jgi:hypothetical protein
VSVVVSTYSISTYATPAQLDEQFQELAPSATKKYAGLSGKEVRVISG